MTKRPVPGLLKVVFAILILLATFTSVLAVVYGRNVTAFWATSGAVGIVLGFALRNMIQDVFTGIAMSLNGAIKEGDWISLHHRDFLLEQYGRVLGIGWRTTRIQLENANVVVVPNGLMGMMAVTNFAHSDHISRLETEIVIDFDVPVDRARRILLAGARAAVVEKGVLADPPPVIVVGEPGERGVTYKVRFWGKVDEQSPSTLQDAVMTHLLKHLHVAGLTPALPKEDVHYAKQPKRLLNHALAEDRREVLSRVDLFAKALNTEELAHMARAVAPREVAAEADLVRQGAPGSSMFVVAEGVLDVFVSQDEGDDLCVGHIRAGEIFGEMSLLTGEPRSATVSATSGALVYEVTHNNSEALLAARPSLAEDISSLVAERRMANARASEVSDDDQQCETSALKQRIFAGMLKMFGATFQSLPKSVSSV